MDDHHPAGLNTSEFPTIFHPAPSPYGLPYRALYSKNIDNLMFAGRNISVTHSAMSSTRVMATCATLGQAVGTGAMLAVKNNASPRGVYQKHLSELQNTIMDDDSWLPDISRPISKLSAAARLSASSGNPEPLRNGFDRPIDENENAWLCSTGDYVEYDFGNVHDIHEIRLVFDSDLKRPPWQMVSNYPLDMKPYMPPSTLVQGYHIEVIDESGQVKEIYRTENNYQRLNQIQVNVKATKVKLVIDKLRDEYPKKIFAFEVK